MSVSRILSSSAHACASAEGGNHLSRIVFTNELKRPTHSVFASAKLSRHLFSRRTLTVHRKNGIYLVFLPVGFVLPSLSLTPRCALTLRSPMETRTFSPLHRQMQMHRPERYIFCDTFRKIALPGCYPAPCPSRGISARIRGMEFGLSS